MAQVTTKPVSGLPLRLEVDTGTHKFICDQPVSDGGSGGGPNPKDLLAASLATCTAQTILINKPKRKWDIQELAVTVSITYPNGASADSDITENIEVKGNLSQPELDAIKRTAERCPVYKLIFGTKTINAKVTKV